MPIRSTTHCKKSLKPGAIVFIPAWCNTVWDKRTPQRFVVAGFPPRGSCCDGVGAVCVTKPTNQPETSGGVTDFGDGHLYLFPGDLGVRGYRYDDRSQQCFTTRKACEAAIKRWKGANPNFIKELLD